MTRVKVRSFTPPGQRLAITAELQPATAGASALFHLAAAAEGKTVATARVEIGERGSRMSTRSAASPSPASAS